MQAESQLERCEDISDRMHGVVSCRHWSPSWRIPAAICALVNVVLLIGTYVGNAEYLIDFRKNGNPDALHYVTEGRNTLLLGHFSRCSGPPFVPDALRTPLYPLFAGALELTAGAVGIYLAQAALHVSACVVVYFIAQRMMTPLAGFLAASFLATDIMIAISNFEAMSEVLFMFLTLLGLLALTPRNILTGVMPGPLRFAFAGCAFAAATLTRPAGLHIPLVVVSVLVLFSLAKHQLHHVMLCAVAMIGIYAIPVYGWVMRNAAVFGVPHVTTSDAIMLVYFTGGGAFEVERGVTLEEAQRQIAAEYELPSPSQTNNHWTTEMSVDEMDERLRSVQRAILLRYPTSLMLSSAMGVAKAHLSHNVGELGMMWGLPWKSRSRAVGENQEGQILSNHWILLAMLAWQLVHVLATLLFVAIGIVSLMRRPRTWWPALLIGAVLAYLLLTVAITGKEAFHRHRTPHMPLMYIFAGIGAAATCTVVGSTSIGKRVENESGSTRPTTVSREYGAKNLCVLVLGCMSQLGRSFVEVRFRDMVAVRLLTAFQCGRAYRRVAARSRVL